MRLLKLGDDDELSLAEFFGNDIPPYAILSHTWGADHDEVTFKDLVDGAGKSKTGHNKIRFCGKQAAKNGLHYFWVDTCCIDKSSSSEISEAINCMFRWYHGADRCYVYLSDVSISGSDEGSEYHRRWKPAFKASRWFKRGWTLQELIAPKSVEFFSKEEQRLGDKESLEQTISEITGINIQALRGSPLSQFGVDERMAWAAGRETKREEDAAYSLLGIFDIQFPLLYGEGREKAFIRLQNHINDSLKHEQPTLHRLAGTEDDSSNRAGSSTGRSVFHGSISGHYVIPGNVQGSVVNFNFSGNATAKRHCDEDCSIEHSKRARVTYHANGDGGPGKYYRGDFYEPDDNDDDGTSSEDSEEGSSENGEGGSSEDSEGGTSEDSEQIDPESESDDRWD